MEQNVKWSDEMTYCDFDGKGKEAKYVRLYLYTPNTNKWLRLYEIEVNGLHLQQQFISKCTLVNDQSLPELTDGNPSTTADSEPGNSAIVYRFMSLQNPTHLEIPFILSKPLTEARAGAHLQRRQRPICP